MQGGEMDGSLEQVRAEIERAVADYVAGQYVTESVRSYNRLLSH